MCASIKCLGIQFFVVSFQECITRDRDSEAQGYQPQTVTALQSFKYLISVLQLAPTCFPLQTIIMYLAMGINFQQFHNIYFQTYASAVDFQSPQVWESFCELLHYMLVNLHWRLTNAKLFYSSNTVEPPNRGHFGTAAFVLSSEVVLF